MPPATALTNTGHDLSGIHYRGDGDHSEDVIAIVVSRWNNEITDALLEGAKRTLLGAGVEESNISVSYVPGSFELPLGAQMAIRNQDVDAVICLGCVIQGETRHFDFICDAVANGIMSLGLQYHLPVIFGVLTPNNQQQAADRAGGKLGNKGEEAAVTVLEMIDLYDSLPELAEGA